MRFRARALRVLVGSSRIGLVPRASVHHQFFTMMFFFNLKLRNKFISLFAIIFIFAGAVIGYSLNYILTAQEIALTMNDLVGARQARIQNMTDGLVEVDQRTGMAIANHGNNSQNMARIRALVPEIQNAAAQLSEARYPQEIQTIKRQINELAATLQERILPLIESEEHDQAAAIFRNDFAPKAMDTYLKLNQIRQFQSQDLNNSASSLSSNTPIVVILAMIGGMIVICIAFAMVLTNDTLHNLQRVIRHARLIAEGDLRDSIKTHRTDEFGEAFNILEEMREALHTKMSAIIDQTQQAVELDEHVLANSQDILALIKKTEDAAIAVAAATNEMVASTQEIASNCEKASTAAQFTNDIATKSMTTVQGSISGIHQQAQQTKLDSDQIVNLVEHSKNINSIVETIDEIAAQTNLLALNAAIEAARAGEAGRGFAVVADEVRALASRTSSSTKEISNMVSRIQKDANDATAAMSNSVASMDEIANSASDVDNQLHEVLHHMGAVTDQVTHIAAATEQQSTTTTDISNNMHDITRSTNEISTETSNTVDSIHEAVRLINQLKDEVAVFKL